MQAHTAYAYGGRGADRGASSCSAAWPCCGCCLPAAEIRWRCLRRAQCPASVRSPRGQSVAVMAGQHLAGIPVQRSHGGELWPVLVKSARPRYSRRASTAQLNWRSLRYCTCMPVRLSPWAVPGGGANCLRPDPASPGHRSPSHHTQHDSKLPWSPLALAHIGKPKQSKRLSAPRRPAPHGLLIWSDQWRGYQIPMRAVFVGQAARSV